jgi:hypothetical protein
MGKETEKEIEQSRQKTHRNKADEHRKKTEKCRVGNQRKTGAQTEQTK